jgi:hypothetical protein
MPLAAKSVVTSTGTLFTNFYTLLILCLCCI